MQGIEELRAYYLQLPYVWEDLPFGDNILVLKVGVKMFACIPLDREGLHIALKCDPERAEDLRSRYNAVRPAYHLNKKHWNGIDCRDDLSKADILDLLKHSYDLVWAKMTKRQRLEAEDIYKQAKE
ncbi:uncharacterized protein YbdF-like [Globicephala melas]|uniref:uncharacterized protein YbdF-like n=1 Tax=Globicephala melas TaxID=9731 RepID=UPI00293D5136|nr:uncharacterized protein YbdF-like [Globicephala melas]